MDNSFELLENREIIGMFKGVKILQTSKNTFLKDALEDLYYERSLENGLCIICNVQTSKVCSHCGAHYCSDNCQKIDWPKHRFVCENKLFANHCSNSIPEYLPNQSGLESFSSAAESKLRYSLKNRPGPMKKEKTTVINGIRFSGNDFSPKYQKSYTGNHDRSKSIRKSNFKINDMKLQKKEEYPTPKSSDFYNRDSENKISGKEICIENKSTKEEDSEWKSIILQNEKSNSMTEFSVENIVDQLKIFSTKMNNLTIGDHLKVKFTFNELEEEKSSLYWIIKNENVSTFECIQKFLSEKCEKFPDAIPQKNGVYGCVYDGNWCRGKVIATEPNLVIHSIDIGVVYKHRSTNVKILPSEYESWNGLAFPVELLKNDENDTNEIKCFSDAFVEVIDINSKGLFQIKLFESMNQKNITDEIGRKDIKEETEQESIVKEIEITHVVQDTQEKLTDEIKSDELGSVVDNLKEGYSGVFQLMKYCDEELYGCLIPENIDDANICHKNMTDLCNIKEQKMEANIGDLVMVLNSDSKAHRGRISSKIKDNRYEIFLIDCGYTIETSKIYELPENAYNTPELACKMKVLKFNKEVVNPSSTFEVNLSYFFEIKGKIAQNKWFCALKYEPGTKAFAEMSVEKIERPKSVVECIEENYIPFESGCKVIMSAASDEDMIYIRRIDGSWEEELEQMVANMNTEIENHQIPADNLILSSLQIGDLICAMFESDNIYYRAKVLSVTGDTVKVLFIDYGNVQETCVNHLKPLAVKFRNKPIFARKITLYNPNRKKISADGHRYIKELIENNKELTMNYQNNSSDSVTLTEEDSFFPVNEFIFDEEMEEEKADVSLELLISRIKFSSFSIGEKKLIILHVDETEFMNDGLFWATDPFHPDFEYIMVELPMTIEGCSSIMTRHTPSQGELCFAHYKYHWYRGMVTKVKDKEFEIFFLDFGNIDVVEAGSILKMHPDLFKKAPAAVKCFFSGFEGMDINMRQNALAYLRRVSNVDCVTSIVDRICNNSCCISFPSFEKKNKINA